MKKDFIERMTQTTIGTLIVIFITLLLIVGIKWAVLYLLGVRI